MRVKRGRGPLGDGHRLERNLRLGSEIQRLVAALDVRVHTGISNDHLASYEEGERVR